MIKRDIVHIIEDSLLRSNNTILFGPKSIGKSTIVENLISKSRKKSVYLNANDPSVKSTLDNLSSESAWQIAGKSKIIVLDQANKLNNLSETLNFLNTEFPNINILATSSIRLDIVVSAKTDIYTILPLSYTELKSLNRPKKPLEQLKHRLIYGMYPLAVDGLAQEKELLIDLISNHLYKDVLEQDGIRKPSVLIDLLTQLALNIGKEVSLADLSEAIGIDRKTINTYIEKLEDAFIVFRLKPLKRKLKNEIGKLQKIYFYDNGVRNALLSSFNSIDLRNDSEELWENFLMAERIKQNSLKQNAGDSYFWRTHAQQSIDYIEEEKNGFITYDFRWRKKRSTAFPKTFLRNYPVKESKIVSQDNFQEFV